MRQAYEAGLLKLKSALAGKVTSMLTDGHALGLLASLKTLHVIGNPDADRPQYDGLKMALALFERGKVKDGPTAQCDGEWYEAEFQRVKAQVLNDHCTVQEFSDKVVHLREELIPNFRTITLKGAMLSEVIVKIMPLCNASEGRTLQREMVKAGTWTDCEAVLRESVAIISGDADAQVEDARRSAAIMPAGAARTSAIAAAASMVPGGGPPPPSGRPPSGGIGGAIGPSSAEVAAATKRTAQEEAKTALAAAVKRAEKETKRQRGLLPTGQWCKQGTCRFPHTDHCTSDPDWVGPLSAEVEADTAHVSRVEGRRVACAKRLHSEGRRSSPVPKPLKKRAAAKPGRAATLALTGPDFLIPSGTCRCTCISRYGTLGISWIEAPILHFDRETFLLPGHQFSFSLLLPYFSSPSSFSPSPSPLQPLSSPSLFSSPLSPSDSFSRGTKRKQEKSPPQGRGLGWSPSSQTVSTERTAEETKHLKG